MLHMELKNQDSWKSKNQIDYWVISELKQHWMKFHCYGIFRFKCIKMNEIVNTFLLVGDKLMPEIHSKQPGFICSTCGPITKNKERF